MSAPTPAPGDDRPREGYYPDPSIPGYVRYWNGAAWVPGTSRPAPKDGESLEPPPGVRPAQPAASVEETGPHFFDEDPVEEPPASESQHGSRPEPASAWGADRSRQSGFGGDQDRRVSWGAPQGAQSAAPRAPHAGGPAQPGSTATTPPADSEAEDAASGSTFVFRRPAGQTGGGAGEPAGHDDEGTMTFRAVSPHAGQRGGASGSGPAGTGPSAGAGAGVGGGAGAGAGSGGSGNGPAPAGGSASGFVAQGQAGATASAAGAASAGFGVPGQGGAGGSQGGSAAPGAGAGGQGGAASAGFGAPGAGRPGFGAGKAAADRAAAGQAGAEAPAAVPTALSGPQQAPSPTVPAHSAGPQPAASGAPGTPLTSGPGGGQSSWAQQVHRLAGAGGGEQPVAPWKPPVEDPFQAAARRQASARPAPLGKRLTARLVDTLVVAGVTAVAAVPLGIKAVDHVNEKIDAAKLSGETVTVWLLDGTTSVYLGIVLAVLLLFGVVYEVLPTAKWGRTLGKKLLGLEVRDIEGHEAPEFGAALRRWLVYSVPGLLVVGVVGVLWCLFDKPWRQCWHDKAARTFVAG
ncbi:RDD family protein [Streptomyces bullii]|uniref:RDD family protein n=1 Tax=Streptomyces bullii TaxID=349910 RepID=A0ABW0UI91_9ACTN